MVRDVQEWNIASRSDSCEPCGRPFADGEEFVTALRWNGAEGYRRRDFCETCWEKEPAVAWVSRWKTVYHIPPPLPDEPLKRETAESLLRKLIETDEQEKLEAMFVLAVMLERRRIFVERDVSRREDGFLMRVYEHRQTGEAFLIADPELQLNELESVQRDVVELLGGRGPGTAEPESERENPERPDPNGGVPDGITA
jgi:hypothetical protein